jgi:hypothetical protein
MRRALSHGDVNGTSRAAVHGTTAGGDSLSTFHLEERSNGQDHTEAIRLLSRLPIDDRELFLAQIRRIVAQKTLVEYEATMVSLKTATSLVLAADRALAWA